MAGELVDPLASVRAYIAAEKSENTRRAYASDWADFIAWCDRTGATALPASAETVARYLAQLADSGLKVSTIERRSAAIRYAHRAANHEPPTNFEGVKAVKRGIRRTVGRKVGRKAPATAAAIATMLELVPTTLIGIRDRALLLLGFAAALRRSELVALEREDIELVREKDQLKGALIRIGRSKTDQEGEGALIAVPAGFALKPLAALLAWLEAAKISSGPVFRGIDRHGNISAHGLNDRTVARVVKHYAGAAGLDEKEFAGHSLRAGFVTSALTNGEDYFKIMSVTRHVSVDTLKIYDRRNGGFDDHAGGSFL